MRERLTKEWINNTADYSRKGWDWTVVVERVYVERQEITFMLPALKREEGRRRWCEQMKLDGD
jgi:hypothetical protein